MMQLAAEEAWRQVQAEDRRRRFWPRLVSCCAWLRAPGFACALGMLALVGFSVWHWWPSPSRQAGPGVNLTWCKLADASNARWAGNPVHIGDPVGGALQLQAGVVELAFVSGAHVAVEGPAHLELTGPNAMTLRTGRLATDVPKKARGFSVQTPNATIVDLGTRFGLDVSTNRGSEVSVFEGRVQVQAGAAAAGGNAWELTKDMAMILNGQGAVTTRPAAERAFPHPGLAVFVRPQNCGFDALTNVRLGGIPAAAGYWSGPAYAIVGPLGGINPVEGAGMLRFLAPPRAAGTAADSEVWQVVDLHSAKAFLTTHGTVDLKTWVQFNRLSGGPHTARTFGLDVAAFRGRPADAAALWERRQETALVVAGHELVADEDPRTWERLEVDTTVPAAADFVVIRLRAVAPPDALAGVDPFPGHFADLIDLKLCVPLGASSLAAVP